MLNGYELKFSGKIKILLMLSKKLAASRYFFVSETKGYDDEVAFDDSAGQREKAKI